MPIPKIFHQIWLAKDGKSVDVPPKTSYQENRLRLVELNPEFKYMWWSNAQIEELFEDPQFTKYKSEFDQLSPHICKCDFVRYMILYKYGGTYFDLDFQFFNPYPQDLLDYNLVMFHEPDFPRNHAKSMSFEKITGVDRIVANNILSSAPGNPMWLRLLDEVVRIRQQQRAKGHGIDSIGDVVSTTGPQIVHRIFYETVTTHDPNLKYKIVGDRSMFFYPKTPSSISHNDWGDSTGWVGQMRMEQAYGRFTFVIAMLIIGILGLLFVFYLWYKTRKFTRVKSRFAVTTPKLEARFT